MSLLDFILGQKIIIISLGIAALLFGLAIIIGIFVSLRQWISRRKAQAALRKIAIEAAAEAEKLSIALQPEPSETVAPAKPAAPAHPTPTPGAPPRPTSPLATPVTPAPAAPQNEAQKTEEVSSAMQDLLTSLFTSDESTERQQALLKGLDDVDINQLTTLSHQIATQLGSRGTAAHEQGA